MPFDPRNPFQDDPSQDVPAPTVREQILASLQQRMAPVPAPDTSALEAEASEARGGSGLARMGIQLSNAFMGRQSKGDNNFSKNLDADAAEAEAGATDLKRKASEADKRREELRNGLSTRFVDDANLTEREKTQDGYKSAAAKQKASDEAAAAKAGHGYKLEEIEAMNRGKIDAVGAKADAKPPKPIEPALLKDKDAMDNTISLLGTIAEMKKKVPTGRGARLQNGAAQFLNIDDPQTSTFRAMVGTQLADYIKSISGAAVSDQERAFLLQNVPSMDDSDETFNSKLAKITERLVGRRTNFLNNLEASGRPHVEELRQVGPQSTTSTTAASIDAKKARLEELRAKKAAAGK